MESFEPIVRKLCSGQVMLYKIDQRGIIQKRNKVELRLLCTALESLPEACIPSLESFGPMMTKLRSGQRKPDAADQSNTYTSPFQATQQNNRAL